MKLRVYSILFFILNSLFLVGQNKLSDQAQISLYTCGAGEDVHNVFGHTAIRVSDPVHTLDIVFNYGIFDFDEPNFALKFLRGKLLYKLGIQRNKNFLRNYEYEERSVYEQVLELDSTEKQKVYDFLVENYKPENRNYKYDFFFDNCSTRARDVFEQSVSGLEIPPHLFQRTFRDMLDEYLLEKPWLDLGIDLIIGQIADDTTSVREQFFLPFYVYDYYDKSIKSNKSWVSKNSLILDFSKKDRAKDGFSFTPKLFFCIMLVFELLILLYFLFRKRQSVPLAIKLSDRLVFFLFGLGSIILAFMWWGTDHMATKLNWNLLWLNPVYLFLLLFYKYNNRMIYKIIAGCMIVVNFMVITNLFQIPQRIHTACYILMLFMIAKLLRIMFTSNIVEKSQNS